MAERDPNSVLFSLKELRQIEEQRTAEEKKAVQDRIEAARRAKEEEEQQVKAAEARLQRAEEERVQREREARERAARDERIQLAEAESRARIEADMRLQQHRVQVEAEAEARSGAHTLRKIVVTVVALAVVVLAGLGYFLKVKSDEKQRAEAAQQRIAQQIEALKQEFAQAQAQFEQDQRESEERMLALDNKLKNAKDAATRELLSKQRADERERAAKIAAARVKAANDYNRNVRQGLGAGARKCPPDDPLCGL